MGELTNKTTIRSLDCTGSYSRVESSLADSIERTFKSLTSTTNMPTSVQTLTENGSDLTNSLSLNLKMDMIAQSLDGLSKQLEELEDTTATQFRTIIEIKKETETQLKVEEAKRIKQEKAMKIELQGIRRRFESFEKKSH